MKNVRLLALLCCLCGSQALSVAQPSWDFDADLNSYLTTETEKIAANTHQELSEIKDWPAYKSKAQEQLLDMLGLNPLPPKTPLKATVTGVVEHEEFRVEKVHFQSMPGLYVTGNLYIPRNIEKPLATILYVCGHANVKENGISYGAKANYQHHPAWFARNGYVCLIIDTYQLGEIEGIHHGLYRYDRWWWISRGFTPAGVEAWNGIRAIDYLSTRPEVDTERIGITGRSGGGVYSWWGTAIDDRIQVAVPVAGITDLRNQVIDGCVEEHCDCMYMVNTHQWDYPKIAALVAPRPLLISNSDQDPMFPIDGVFRTYQEVRAVYEQLDALPQIALNTVSGGHKDIQSLRIHAFSWFNRHLQGHDKLIDMPATKLFEPEQLRVFDELPTDEVNTKIDEIFVPKAPPAAEVLAKEGWEKSTARWREVLRNYRFSRPSAAKTEKIADFNAKAGQLELWKIHTDEWTQLPIFRLKAHAPAGNGRKVILLDKENWPEWASLLGAVYPDCEFGTPSTKEINADEKLEKLLATWDEIILISMRGAGPAAFSGNDRKQTHIRRRFFLLGQTLEEFQTLDVVQAIRSLHLSEDHIRTVVSAKGITAGILVYAALFCEKGLTLELQNPPLSHRIGPDLVNIMRFQDMSAAILMAAALHEVGLEPGGTPLSVSYCSGLKELADQYPGLGLYLK